MSKWFDVHFSLNGFYKIEANNEEEAMEKAEETLSELRGSVEVSVNTGLGIEIIEAIPEED